ncbi:hypothetical protein J6590_006191 [Homalodisca vitripennis]|nr:hypothetical protein J6590_006191 [Homalodisca vitripennis]
MRLPIRLFIRVSDVETTYRFVLSFFVADFLWIFSDEHYSRFQESSLTQRHMPDPATKGSLHNLLQSLERLLIVSLLISSHSIVSALNGKGNVAGMEGLAAVHLPHCLLDGSSFACNRAIIAPSTHSSPHYTLQLIS